MLISGIVRENRLKPNRLGNYLLVASLFGLAAVGGPLRNLPVDLHGTPAIADEPQPGNSARSLYARAALALQAKNTALAAAELESLIRVFPEDPLAPVAAIHLAECQLAQGEPDPAMQLLEKWLPKLAQTESSEPTSRAHVLHAQWLQARAQIALQQPREASLITQNALRTVAATEVHAAAEQKWIDQLRSLDSQLKQQLQQLQAQLLRAAAEQVRKKDFNAALTSLAQCQPSDMPEAWHWRYQLLSAQSHLGQARPDQAIEAIDAIELDGLTAAEQAAVHWVALDAALASHQASRAAQEVDALKPLVAGDDDLAATVALRDIEVAMLRKNRTEVRIKSTEAKQAFPNYARRHEFDLLLARNAIAEVQFAEARQILQTIIDAPPEHDPTAVSRAQWLMAETYFLARDYPSAIAAYSAVVQRGGQSEWLESALLQRGKCFELQGDRTAAAQDYQRVIQGFPQSRLAASAADRLTELETSLRSASNPTPSPQR